MNGETDYGIIMSALAMGDLMDVQDRIEKRIMELKAASKINPKKKYDEYIRMLAEMQSVFAGKTSIEDFRQVIDTPPVSDSFRFVDDWEDFVNTIVYYLYYFTDRYNIHLPAFDSKRSDDR